MYIISVCFTFYRPSTSTVTTWYCTTCCTIFIGSERRNNGRIANWNWICFYLNQSIKTLISCPLPPAPSLPLRADLFVQLVSSCFGADHRSSGSEQSFSSENVHIINLCCGMVRLRKRQRKRVIVVSRWGLMIIREAILWRIRSWRWLFWIRQTTRC